jgi:DNA-binding NtrC family response regulator
MLEAKRRAQRLARAVAPVLVEGAGGTGKARLAQAIHEASPCAGGPFVAVPCLTLDSEELTATLFGREPAANGTPRGLVEEADGGSLYLDEVARLSLSAQLGLLRLVQEGVLPVPGGFPPRRVHVRVLAGTAEDLVQAVAEGRFRLDLFQRLKVLSVRLPGLHERTGDMAALVARFLSELEATHGLGVRQASDGLVARLASLRLDGHLDELKRLLEQMYVMTDTETLEPAHLPSEYLPPGDAMGVATARIDELERAAITQALALPGAKASAVARELGISRSTLYRKLKRYGLA